MLDTFCETQANKLWCVIAQADDTVAAPIIPASTTVVISTPLTLAFLSAVLYLDRGLGLVSCGCGFECLLFFWGAVGFAAA